MNKIEEVLYDRLGVSARLTGKRYAIMQRGAWGERCTTPFRAANTVEFKGRLVKGDRARFDDGEVVPIGFYHPIFTGYIGTYGVVEVIDNTSKETDVRYSARGKGQLTIAAGAVCIDPPNFDPCNPVKCNTYRVGVGGASAALGTDDSFALYDILTRNDPIGRNEIPARLALRGYTGARQVPNWPKSSVLFTWSPGVSAFDPTFQLCGTPAGANTWGFTVLDCCALIDQLRKQFGDGWWNQIKPDPGNPIPLIGPNGSDCSWVYFYNWMQHG